MLFVCLCVCVWLVCVFYLQVRRQWTHKVLILCFLCLCTQDKIRNPRPSWIGTNKYACPLLVVFEYVFLSCIAMIFNMISVIVNYFVFTLGTIGKGGEMTW